MSSAVRPAEPARERQSPRVRTKPLSDQYFAATCDDLKVPPAVQPISTRSTQEGGCERPHSLLGSGLDAESHGLEVAAAQRNSPGRKLAFSFLQSRPKFVKSTFHSPLSHPRVILPLTTQICEPFEYILLA